MASTVESVQPSTSNFPTTITAEILVENLPSAQVVTTSTSMASTVSMSVSNSSILAAISSPNTNNNNNESPQSGDSSPPQPQIPAGPVETTTPEKQHTGEPDAKRRKLDTPTKAKIVEKLEARLGGILCCAVCLDLPRTAMYQCPMGHLMCAACFTHLLADGRLRDQVATCPNCRVEISKQNASRNLAVEKAVSELPSQCQYCSNEYPSKSLEHHELNECDERPTNCKFSRIGCQWKGPIHEAPEHEKVCIHPRKSGGEVMSALEDRDAKHAEEKKLFLSLVDLLSYEKIIFNDLQLKPYRTDEYVHKLYYETSKFSAFNHQWVVKATINNSQRDVHESSERSIAYQLILKSKTTCPLQIHYFVLKGPFSDMKVNTKIYKHDFTDSENESKNNVLPLPDTAECNRHLASKAINFRLIMFLASK